MTRSLRLSAVSSALAIAAVLAFSGQAQAHQVKGTYTGMEDTDETSYSGILPPWSGTSATTGRRSAGILNVRAVSGPSHFFGAGNDEFVSFCIDLPDPIRTGDTVTWDVVSLAQALDVTLGPMGAKKASDRTTLLGRAITSGVLNYARDILRTHKQALQIAVWEVVNENRLKGHAFHSGDAAFSGLASGVGTQVDSYLAGIAGAAAMQGLVGPASDTKQDDIGQTPISQVPIPPAAWLFGSAMVGAVALGRRRKGKGDATTA